MMPARWYPTLTCLVLSLAGCGSGADDAAVDTGAAPAPAESEGNPTERALHAHLVLTGGKYAGTYDHNEPEGLCAATKADGSGANLAFPYATSSTPGSLQNVALSADEPSATGSRNFEFTANVTGSDGLPHDVRISPAKGVGTGSAVVTGKFPIFTVKVQGTTADGVKVDATLECAKSK